MKKLTEAYDYAARMHAGQLRKGAARVPYINHPCEVAALVAGAGASESVVIAAVLHDTVEDTAARSEEIDTIFGAEVAGIVAELTNDPAWSDLTKLEMKARQSAHIRCTSVGARTVKIADQTANLFDIARDPAAWEPERARDYVVGAVMVVDACRGVSASLEAGFDAAVVQARLALGLIA